MPSIKLTKGQIHYNSVSLYRGVKIIDKKKAGENLILLKKILDKNNISFQLAFGTLLGAVRDKDFITHDEDIDLIVFEKDKQKLLDILPELLNEGFKVGRYDRRGLLSIIRNGEYIDIYFFKKHSEGLLTCSGILCPTTFLVNSTKYEFRGNFYNIPIDYEGFFEFEYGENWKIPIQWANYEVPLSKRLKLWIRDYFKDLLPDFLYFKLAFLAEKKMEERYMPKVIKYKNKNQH